MAAEQPAPLPAGVTARRVETARLDTYVLERGPTDGEPLLLVHGNVSSSRFFAETMAALPEHLRIIAPDLRSFGASAHLPVDATRGVRDFSDDLVALMDALGIAKAHLLGWSVGGGVVMQLAIDHPERVASLTLESPMSPRGFGGTKGATGEPCWPDYAGTGGGTANPDFVQRLGKGDRSAEAPTSPRSIMSAFYFKPPFMPAPALTEAYLDSMLSIAVGEGHYPGDLTTSDNWPGVAPGKAGVNNAISGQYVDLRAFAEIQPRPPVLWVRGADDQIVSDASMFDFGTLGQLGAVPGWPGAEVFPPQPMLGQMRAVLDAYREKGGAYTEVVLPDCGHSPHVEHPKRFVELLSDHIG